MVELALFEPQLPLECPAHATSPDVEDQETSHREEQVVHLNFLAWRLLRLALLLHCLPVCVKLARIGYFGLVRIWQKLCQTRIGCDETLIAGLVGPTHVALRAEWAAELAHERLLIEHSLARLHMTQSEFASMRTGQFVLGHVG